MPTWPTPYLQPNPKEDCSFYATAYICRCLGHPIATAEQVKAWRENGHTDGKKYYEGMYPVHVLGHTIERFWRYLDGAERDEDERRRFWLGDGTREWVEQHLASGKIALVLVHRIQEMAHAVVLLESRGDAGVLLMDPIYGHIVESWEWFLGIGPGHHGCHHIDGWYTLPHESAQFQDM